MDTNLDDKPLLKNKQLDMENSVKIISLEQQVLNVYYDVNINIEKVGRFYYGNVDYNIMIVSEKNSINNEAILAIIHDIRHSRIHNNKIYYIGYYNTQVVEIITEYQQTIICTDTLIAKQLKEV